MARPEAEGSRTTSNLAGRVFDRLIAAFNALGSAWIFLLMLLILADVVGRGAFSAPVRGVPEMVALSIVAIVFMQAAHTLKIGRMTRSDAVLDKLAATRPRTRSVLLAINDVFGFAVMAILAWATGPRAFKSWEYQDYVGAVGYFTAPIWPIYLAVALGAGLCAIQYLRSLVGNVRAVLRREPRRNGVA